MNSNLFSSQASSPNFFQPQIAQERYTQRNIAAAIVEKDIVPRNEALPYGVGYIFVRCWKGAPKLSQKNRNLSA